MFRDTHFVLRPRSPGRGSTSTPRVDAALDADAGETVTPRLTFARAALTSFAARLAKRDRSPRARGRHRVARRQARPHPCARRPRGQPGDAGGAARAGHGQDRIRAPRRGAGAGHRASRPHVRGPRQALPDGHRRRPRRQAAAPLRAPAAAQALQDRRRQGGPGDRGRPLQDPREDRQPRLARADERLGRRARRPDDPLRRSAEPARGALHGLPRRPGHPRHGGSRLAGHAPPRTAASACRCPRSSSSSAR